MYCRILRFHALSPYSRLPNQSTCHVMSFDSPHIPISHLKIDNKRAEEKLRQSTIFIVEAIFYLVDDKKLSFRSHNWISVFLFVTHSHPNLCDIVFAYEEKYKQNHLRQQTIVIYDRRLSIIHWLRP